MGQAEDEMAMQVVSNVNASVRTADSVRRHRIGGLTLAEYAEASAAREIVLDEADIVVTWSGVRGNVAVLWPKLSAHAARYGVPFHAGDLERTNRIQEWEDAILSSRHAQAAWRDCYARALLRLQGIDETTIDGRARVEVLKSSEICLNALAHVERRRPGMTGLAVRPTDRRTPVPPSENAAPMDRSIAVPFVVKSERAPAMDPVVFPGEKLSRVSDFVRIELAARQEGLDAALAREGIAPAYHARMVSRLEALMDKDPWIAQKRAALLGALRVPAPALAPAPALTSAPAAGDPVVFPGERLSRLSDFVRMAKAARKADFLGALHREGIHPIYYAHMRKRFAAMCQADPRLDLAFREGLGNQ